MSRQNRIAGSIGGEIILVNTDLISVRLKDGSFLGPQLKIEEVTTRSGGKTQRLVRVPGEKGEPLVYTPEIINIIHQHSWNGRKDYGDIEDLKKKLLASGGVPPEPLLLALDGSHLAYVEGHRRGRCISFLKREGHDIPDTPSIIHTIGGRVSGSSRGMSWEELELTQLSSNDKKPLTLGEKGDLLQRQLNRNLTLNDLVLRTGLDIKEINNYLFVAGQPYALRQLLDQGDIAITTLKKAQESATSKGWTSAQFASAMVMAVQTARENGWKKASGEFVLEFFDDIDTPPEPIPDLPVVLSTVPTTTSVNTTANANLQTIPRVDNPPLKVKFKSKSSRRSQIFNELLERTVHERSFIDLEEFGEDTLFLPVKRDEWNEYLRYYSEKRNKSQPD